ncbi:hypothetical protein C479_09233 [Halovivax asiaticus JCM 14624]|uniref:DUF7344 domain-containing protein n=1 Tax=Halovivax asiaticus JCM 14624 TaxID=1227490 RepID=M0BKJ0_9EURY|nr:hypothetical protein [Halovivax asiaticus]ELZ10982.1 hypothetical protein C479_09233 [Halovivax asiaticus JCM 14624]
MTVNTESVDVQAVEESDADDVTENTIARDEIFHILQCRRRRLVLKYLQEFDTPAKMTDITERIAAFEHDTTVAALKSQERQRVYIALYQSHLPKLDDEGIIEYQQNRGIVERTERAAAFDRYLDEEPSLRDDVSERPMHDAGDATRERDTPDTQTEAFSWEPAHAYVGASVALVAGIYATLANTIVPSGVGAAIAVIAVAVFAANWIASHSDE